MGHLIAAISPTAGRCCRRSLFYPSPAGGRTSSIITSGRCASAPRRLLVSSPPARSRPVFSLPQIPEPASKRRLGCPARCPRRTAACHGTQSRPSCYAITVSLIRLGALLIASTRPPAAILPLNPSGTPRLALPWPPAPVWRRCRHAWSAPSSGSLQRNPSFHWRTSSAGIQPVTTTGSSRSRHGQARSCCWNWPPAVVEFHIA